MEARENWICNTHKKPFVLKESPMNRGFLQLLNNKGKTLYYSLTEHMVRPPMMHFDIKA